MTQQLRFVSNLATSLRVAPGRKVSLQKHFDPSDTRGVDSKTEAAERLAEGVALLVDYQDRLSAQDIYGVLMVLQGIDAAGKDSTIKHVMSGVNPQGVEVRAFKQPSEEELARDFLWRYQRRLPERGRIGIFNRSHYEEVLVVRVHTDLLDAERMPESMRSGDIWEKRYRQINDWEHHLIDSGIKVVKVFLNLSKAEQSRRFLARINDPAKNWKFSARDVYERQYWDDYQEAFEDMLTHTSTEWAPWHVVPADHKWFTRLATAAVLVSALADIDPQYPVLSPTALNEMTEARNSLLEESGAGSARRA